MSSKFLKSCAVAAILAALRMPQASGQDVEKILEILRPLSQSSQPPPVGGNSPAETKTPPPQAAAGSDQTRTITPVFLFRNGNIVRGALAHEALPIATPYGVLQVPVKEIQEIFFVVKPLPETEKAIADAIQELGNESFEKREAATAAIREHLADAIPALKGALKSGDEEIRLRAESLLQEEANQPLETTGVRGRPLPRDHDLIVTAGYSIQGSIQQEVFSVQCPYGKLSVPRRELLNVRFQEDSLKNATLSIGAENLIPATWLDTKIRIEPGKQMAITASGTLEVPNWGETCGPEGSAQHGLHFGFNMMALVGKIGKTGETFLIGREYRNRAAASGTLYLGIVPFRYSPATGSYDVKIQVR